jgi:hypothetical protein
LCGSFGLLSLIDLGCVVWVLWFTFSQRFGLCCVGPLVYFLSKIWAVLCVSFGLLSLKDLGCLRESKPKDPHNTTKIFERK